MPSTRTDEAEHWFNAVYEAVQRIPRGKVCTYGHIARLLGYPQRARQVGVCLKHLPAQRGTGASNGGDEEEYFHNGNVPWQRVVNSKGGISPRGPGSAERQAQRLREEGVEVEEPVGIGEWTVDLGRWGWFPEEVDLDGESE